MTTSWGNFVSINIKTPFLNMRNSKLSRRFIYVGSFLLISTSLIFWGCSNPGENHSRPVSGEGPVIEMNIPVDPFNQINHVCMGDMEIIVSDTLQVVMEAQQNIIDLMDWTVQDSTLYWGFTEAVEIVEAEKILCKIKMPVPLVSLILTGVGQVGVSGPKQNSIYLQVDGVGNIGAYDLEVDKAEADITGYGNIEVRVISELIGIISGKGNVLYRGDPLLNVHVSGSGEFIDDN